MIARLTLIAALALSPLSVAAPAAAQDPAPPASAEQVAEARAAAGRLIEAAGAQGIFIDATGQDGRIAVKHVASGLRCGFLGNEFDRIIIFPDSGGGVAPGEDVGCVTHEAELDIDLTLYATRYRPLPTEQQVLDDASRAIVGRFPEATPYEGDLATMSRDGQTPTLTAAYRLNPEDRDSLTLALVSHRDGWGFKARATGPYAQAMAVSLYAGVMFEGALVARSD